MSWRWVRGLVQMMFCVVVVSLGACSEDSPTEPPKGDGGIDMVVDANTMDLGHAPAGVCDSLKVTSGNHLVASLFARGDQVYRWDGTAWVFVEPVAKLYLTRWSRFEVGTHYVGPTWETLRGSKVVGAVVKRCPAPNGSIPWLLLSGAPSGNHGLFSNVSFIQRVNTTGGVAPSQAGSSVGEIKRVPYTADYRFYYGK